MKNWREQFRSAFATMWGHHLNESMAMDRAFTAKARGLDETQFANPFTQQNVTNVSNTQPASPLRGLLIGAALATTLLGTGGLGGFALTSLLAPKPAVPDVVHDVTKEVWDSAVRLEVEPPK